MDTASDVIGSIPLIISSVLLLQALVKTVRFLQHVKQKWLKRPLKERLLQGSNGASLHSL